MEDVGADCNSSGSVLTLLMLGYKEKLTINFHNHT